MPDNQEVDARPENESEPQAVEETQNSNAELLDTILNEGKMILPGDERQSARNLIEEFARQCLAEGSTVSKSSVAKIMDLIAKIDEKLTRQLNVIMHNPEFQALESAWRGLEHLVMNTETSATLKLKVMSVSKKDLLDDLEKATEFDQSALWKKVYEEEYGMYGGSPFGLLIGDYHFGRLPQDIDLLSRVSKVAAGAFAPFISAASPLLFGMESYEKLNAPRDLQKIFESADTVTWRSFRKSPESRYVALTLPRVLMRLPYGPNTRPVSEFRFVEDVNGKDHSKYCWGNSAYALGVRVTNAFAKYAWCTAIRGVEGGGLVQNLPLHTFVSDGEMVAKIPTEVAIPDRRDKELSDLGFMALCNAKGDDVAAFFSGQTVNLPEVYMSPDATANERISSTLPYQLAACRFAHYLKAIMRDKVGSFQSRKDVETFLRGWIKNYVLAADDSSQEMKAQYPLREAKVEVTEVPGEPGKYSAIIWLRPHFQLEGLSTSLRLVADLPPSVR